MKHGGKQVYSFGEIQVNLLQQTLTYRGEELHLRQRSFEVLVYFLQNRDRLVTKEELIENVWKVAAITDDALVKSVVEIRKAIGDDSRAPHFLKTVPKIGYRFIGPVQETLVQQSAEHIEQIRSIEFELEEEVEELPVAALPAVPMERGQLQAPDRKTRPWHWSTIFVLLVAALSFYAGSRFFVDQNKGTATTIPESHGKKTVAVAFFDNLSGDRDLDWMREGLADMVITGLSQSNELNLLGRQQFYLLLQRIGHTETEKIRLNDALEIARRSKAQMVVLGGFTKMGDQIRIDAQLYDARNGQLISTDHLSVEKPEEILTNIDLLSLKIASRLGAAPHGRGSTPEMTQVMTNNLNAYRYYSLAVEKAQGLHNTEAIDLLKKAIAMDSDFAMAHARIGYAYAVTWTLLDQAKPHLQKAFQMSERLTSKDKLYISAWYAITNQDYALAIASFRNVVNQYPFELEAYARLAKLLQGEGRYEEAIDTLKKGLVMDPEAGDIQNGLGLLYSALGRHKEAIHVHQKFLQLAPGEPNAHDSLGLSYQAAGLYPKAIEEYNRALALDPDFEVAVVHLGNTYLQLGRYRDAIREFERYIQIAPSELERTRGLDSVAYVYWKKGELDLAEQTLGKIRDEGFAITPILLAADRGDKVRTAALRAQYFQTAPSDRGSRLNARLSYFPMAYALMKNGSIAEAIEIYRKARVSLTPTWNYDAYEDCLANAYLQSGRIDDAISEYRRILQLNPNYPLVHYHLALAYEAQGRNDLAHAEYKTFLKVWKDADRDLPQIISSLKRVDQFQKEI